jgi:undecaprenyl-phosphate 4-deoxy-4-formamido-L-arabinose transferase
VNKISFIVPCYGSEKTVGKVVSDISTLMKQKENYEYEIILVNDCSPDAVWQVIKQLCVQYPKTVKGISLAKNFGQHSALMAGYHISRGDYVVTLDDDGQTPVGKTFALLDELVGGGYDVVYARYEGRKDNSFRKAGTLLNNVMLELLLDKPKEVHLTSFFVARKFVIQEICTYKNAFPYIWGLVLRTTHNIANVTIPHSSRVEGESGYTLKKLIGLWMNGFTAFSVKPLRVSSGIGVLCALLGAVGACYTAVDKLMHPQIPAGYSSLMSVLLVIGGILMILLGLIGEYVGRIYLCINTMPQYIVRETFNGKGEILDESNYAEDVRFMEQERRQC